MDLTADAIKAVMAKEPQLTQFGFGVYDEHRLSTKDRATQLASGRADMLEPAAQHEFSHAVAYLSRCRRTKHINPHAGTSYGLKHRAENWGTEAQGRHVYVSNGMLIAAAIHIGLKYKRFHDTPNAMFNLSSAPPAPAEAPKRGVLVE